MINNAHKYTLAELFAGTGGFSLAFKSTKRVSIVFANDCEKHCKQLYDLNFKNKMTLADINKYNINKIPNMDILTFGSPCQSFSIAGERKGFNDKRGNVFWRIIEILKLKKPKCFIMENVKNLKSHDSGRTFKIMLDNFEKNNYHIIFKVLNTCEYTNIPQNRERIFVIGFLDKYKADNFKFPTPKNEIISLSNFLNKTADKKFYYTKKLKVWELVNKSITKSINENVIYQYRRTIVRENKKNLCPTLTANMGSGGHNVPLLKDKNGIRKLTPKECFRLQGFPDNFKLDGLSNASLYKMAGNAITVDLVKLLAEEVIKILDIKKENEEENDEVIISIIW